MVDWFVMVRNRSQVVQQENFPLVRLGCMVVDRCLFHPLVEVRARSQVTLAVVADQEVDGLGVDLVDGAPKHHQ